MRVDERIRKIVEAYTIDEEYTGPMEIVFKLESCFEIGDALPLTGMVLTDADTDSGMVWFLDEFRPDTGKAGNDPHYVIRYTLDRL